MKERGGSFLERTRAALMAAADGDSELAVELAEVFVEDSATILDELRRATHGGNLAAVGAAAHTLKGAAATLGFDDLAREALALELWAREGILDEDRGGAAQLRRLTVACAEARNVARLFLESER